MYSPKPSRYNFKNFAKWFSFTNRLACLAMKTKSIFCSVVVDVLLVVTPIVGACNCSTFCYTLLFVHSSIAIILIGKRELVALLNLSSWCLVMVEWLFLVVPWGCLRFVIVVFHDHTHYFLYCALSFLEN